MQRRSFAILTGTALGLSLCLLASITPAQIFTIENGSMVQDATGDVPGWDGTSNEGRACGGYLGAVAYQAINSPTDSDPSSGSITFTANSAACSLTQGLGITASGQAVEISADIAWDGDWDFLYFGFYTENDWDRVAGASVDISTGAYYIPPDTDGTLDSFRTIIVSGTLPTNLNPVRVFFGSSCSPWGGGAKTIGSSQFAVDNVRTTTRVSDWEEY